MVNAIILMKVARGQVPSLAEKLVQFTGVSEVFSVAGPYDLIIVVRVANNDALAHLVTHDMASLEGIVETETLLAFKAYSKDDMEEVFAIGMDGV